MHTGRVTNRPRGGGDFLYDGDCAFCSACARLAQRRLAQRGLAGAARIVPWQRADLTAAGLTATQCDESVWWVGTGGVRAAGPDAIGYLLRAARPGPLAPLYRLAGWLLGRRPVAVLAWPAYRWVARNRHRLPGGTPACAVPGTQREPPGATPYAA